MILDIAPLEPITSNWPLIAALAGVALIAGIVLLKRRGRRGAD